MLSNARELRPMSTLISVSSIADLTLAGDTEDVTGMKGRIRLTREDGVRGGRWMDQSRKQVQAYDYLCHIGEAKEWIEACINEEIDAITTLEESLRNGVVLAKLARFFDPPSVKKIFEHPVLQYKHSDNINCIFKAMRNIKLPEIFIFELTDLYDKKNIPKVIYCIHALSHMLANKGMAPNIKNLVGELQFTDAEIHATRQGLDAAGISLPSFGNVGSALAKELNGPEMAIAEVIPEEEEEEEEEEPETLLSNQELRDLFWANNTDSIVRCQQLFRGALERKRFLERRNLHYQMEEFLIKVQAQSRGELVRRRFWHRVQQLRAFEPQVVTIQAHLRGFLQRKKYQDRQNYYKANVNTIVKMQSLFRAKAAGEAYRSLTTGASPPITTLKTFLHLLNDSDFDFEEELELENLRQLVVRRIRENTQSDAQLNELDIKIALLVQNHITLDEVIKTTSSLTKKKAQRRLSMPASATNNPYTLKSLDRESRDRLVLYQQLFYLLQTQPAYFSKLFFMMSKTGLFTDRIKKQIEGVVLTLFGYAQNSREEYLLLKLFKQSIFEEVGEILNVNDFMRGNFMFVKMVMIYVRGAKERRYLRDLLGPLVRQVLEDDFLDLESDPLMIYKASINNEELRTGRPSERPLHIDHTEALNDPETRTTFIRHLQELRLRTEMFLDAILESLPRMPYGIRYIAKEVGDALRSKFPHEPEENITKAVGNLIYYRYLNPAIVAPEGFDVIEGVVNPMQRKNLAEISKMLNQISVGKLFSDDNVYLKPLNEYVGYAGARFAKYFKSVVEVVEPEKQFEVNEYVDQVNTIRPTVYISPYEIFNMHAMLASRIDVLAPEMDDPLRVILSELGNPPSGYEEHSQGHGEVCLTLQNRFTANLDDPDMDLKHLFVETKRYILAIIRIQSGKNLMEILERRVTIHEEQAWEELKATELNRQQHHQRRINNASGSSIDDRLRNTTNNMMADMNAMRFIELKQHAIDGILQLESTGKVTRKNGYQDMISAIAVDIRTKHRRRIQRAAELNRVKQTLSNLNEKKLYLENQIKSYHDYVESCMTNITTKKGKKQRYVMPFTKQYFHIRNLQRHGRLPQFGSFKYTAQKLFEKGVLLNLEGVSPKQYSQISLTISCDEPGLFQIEAEASIMMVRMPVTSMELRLEDLLQCQFNNIQIMSLFDNMAKVNVNLLLFLVNKKFYV
ncbi:hypothetical protein BC939DRAFT_435523 [Gamsiella multidivaricata]|uniref:uncharacterized protein n=1 Tax=Gamsiella multidivaricata TaxID=101098 RepID=UPI00221ED6FE|nr:uncharacterized protein BC939DRAFT_435523 [Gamsiella multidivaricata]KAI7832446.1 hypothetical protein BC939DRAFT_435523 [Gamsiella multidivaricata]